jgi:hypothetical protein
MRLLLPLKAPKHLCPSHFRIYDIRGYLPHIPYRVVKSSKEQIETKESE